MFIKKNPKKKNRKSNPEAFCTAMRPPRENNHKITLKINKESHN